MLIAMTIALIGAAAFFALISNRAGTLVSLALLAVLWTR